MERKQKTALIVCAALFLLLVLPFFLGAPAAHPATDDFTFATYTHKTWLATHSLPHVLKDSFSYALRTWRDWQGTVTGVIIMTLNPAVFSLKLYGVHAVILLLLDIAAMFTFLGHFLKRAGLQTAMRRCLTLCLTAVSLLFLPDIVEGIYWFNGAWFYTGANAACLLLLTGIDSLAVKKGGCVRLALLAFGCFALGMDNFITAMMCGASLLMLGLLRLYRGERRAAVRTLLFLLPLGLGLLLSVIAPGNSVRMATDGAHESGLGWLFATILWTLRDAFFYILRFSLRTPLLAILMLLTPALCRSLPGKEGVPPVWAGGLGFYAILCAMIIPHMYSSGYAGSGRVVNMYHDYVLTAMPLLWCMVIRRMPASLRGRIGRGAKCCVPAALVCAALCLAGGQLGNYAKLVRDQLDGTQDAYIAQFQHEYALCEVGSAEDDILLPAWKVQTVTGKATVFPDASVWTNVSMADYFGVHSVRCEESENP